MEKKSMFGEIGTFADKAVFESHRYANLYYDEKDHGIEFFAFVHTDAYDNTVFTAGVCECDWQAYLDNLLSKAVYTRDVGVTTNDKIILLSTCSSSSTNGRDILVGRITDKVYEDPFINVKTNDRRSDDTWGFVKEIPLWVLLLIVIIPMRVVMLILVNRNRARQYKREKIQERDT